MDKHLRRCIVILMLALGVLMSLSATTTEYPTGLDVSWTFGAAHETFESGFTNKKPAPDLNMGWENVSMTDSIEMTDFISNSASFHKSEGNVYAYWNFFSNESFSVMLSSSGPFVYEDAKHNENNRNMINWQASWTPLSVNANGDIIELVGSTVFIGRNDNAFESIEDDYSSPKLLFRQDSDDYPLKSKYGFILIHIETQDTKAEDILASQSKVKGNYSTTLIMDVIAK